MLVCLLATSTGELPTILYLGMAFCLVAGALSVQRVQRYGLVTWATTIMSMAIVTVTIQTGFSSAQNSIEDSVAYWFNQFAWFQTDPVRELTSIGSIARLKLSDRIRVRLKTPLSTSLPIMLHEASYSNYHLGVWTSSDNEFEAIDPVPETSTWVLDQPAPDHELSAAKIIVKQAQDVAVAPMPYGAKIIYGSELVEVQHNRFGTILVEASPGQLEYDVSWSTQNTKRTLPTAEDLSVPNNYAHVISELADEINIEADDPVAAVAKLVKFFHANFKYSLIKKNFYPGRTSLSHFLLLDRRGHCEYFATASALLLRHAGIPARYAVGYVVDEYSPLEKAFIARARHAHSWTEAFIDNRWITVDTTPSEWYQLEHARASNWQHVQDIWSWITNQYARFQRSDRKISRDSLIWSVPPLILILLWRLRSRMRNTGLSQIPSQSIHATIGQDSELYQLSQILRTKGYALHAGDTLKTFLVRNVGDNVSSIHLARLFDLHYRYRFSGDGLTPTERSELRIGAIEYCQRYSST
ncbi:MAG: transglutaminase-like domain-containing protein, partial [Gammaproteobacteria bacterium]